MQKSLDASVFILKVGLFTIYLTETSQIDMESYLLDTTHLGFTIDEFYTEFAKYCKNPAKHFV